MSDMVERLRQHGSLTETEAANEIERLQKVERDCKILHGYEAMQHRWLGECGHEWRKDQANNCPICERDRLREILNSQIEVGYVNKTPRPFL